MSAESAIHSCANKIQDIIKTPGILFDIVYLYMCLSINNFRRISNIVIITSCRQTASIILEVKYFFRHPITFRSSQIISNPKRRTYNVHKITTSFCN